jgi:pseudaminic acid cytidylyltransferase
MSKRIAIVPARAGSKRIPKKNIRNFCGKPIICYILSAISESSLFDVVHVSTDCHKIASIVESAGYPVDFLRPHNLADDFTPLYPVAKFVLNTYLERGQSFDTVALLMPCSPLITSSDLTQACALFENSTKDLPLLSVSQFPVPIQWSFNMNHSSVLSARFPGFLDKRSQDLPVSYFDTGQFEFFKPSSILNQTIGVFNQYLGYIIPSTRSVDIDTIDDWHLAEALYHHMNYSSDISTLSDQP